MDDERALAEYGIQKESTINMVMSLCGGGKKRKKKNYVSDGFVIMPDNLAKLASVDHPQEDQAQEEEGQDGHPQVLQGRIRR